MIEVQPLTDVSVSRYQEINDLLKWLSPNAELITRCDLKKCLETQHYFIFISFDSDKKYPIVGMATIFFVWKCSGWLAEIHDVVVAPAYRGKHIGDMLTKKLLETASWFATKEGKKLAVYLTSKPHRVAANNMYLKHGFKLVAKAEGEEGTNLYKMVVEPNHV